ncbi:MFS general substrate transporter [Lindgomyces ingoldianus]|uniref:MFS general substrate transporter n=1 Tax=Lindgomyces ingoldianus TaxID=673940 RepID=A0ACB6R6Y2_9PLEO|nr:MFS general substrate transporter [Lindgomyces ingoldianus]KAF2474911.1 MFS general substrate transporter [Lindgomyces ingoldianus]
MEKAEVSDLHSGPSTTISLGAEGPQVPKTRPATPTAIERVVSHLTMRSIANPGPPPDGGLQAWTQVFCAWLAILNTWGFVNSFGAFQTYYASILPQSNSTISWIGSTQACLMFLLGTFSGRALDAGLFRPTIIIGIAFQLVGIFTMSLAKNYWQLLLTQGICTGIGGGIFFCPVMGLVSTYFAKRRGMAIGIVTSGNSAGGIIYPIVVRQLLDKVGFGWTVRVLGFINVVSLAVVIAFMKPRLPPRRTGPIIDTSAFTDVPYILHVLGTCFLMPPVYFAFYYIASFARDELHMPYATSLNLVMILNGIGIPARVLPGYIADHYIGVLNTFSCCLLLSIIMLWAWLGIHSIASFYAFTAIYGLAAAAFQSLFPTSIAALGNDIMKTGTRLGMAFTVISFSALVGGPIAGALLKAAGGSYVSPICWSAANTVVGMALC